MLTLDRLLASKDHDVELPPLATIKQIIISNISASAGGIAIDEINIDSLSSDIILSKEKLIANLVVFSAESESTIDDKSAVDNDLVSNERVNQDQTTNKEAVNTEPTVASTPLMNGEDTSTTTAKEDNFQISLHAFNVINNNQINFVDNSVDPVYKRVVYLDKIHLGALSNHFGSQEKETPIELMGRSNQYAKFNFSGFMKPFAKIKTYHVKGGLSELSLPAVSTYMKGRFTVGVKKRSIKIPMLM